jgi:4-oxalocrotonate tautomerase family enzyme
VPLVRIDLVGGRRPELLRALIDRVHRTVADTLDVPPGAVTVIVDEHPAELWATAGVTKAEQRAQADQPTPQP